MAINDVAGQHCRGFVWPTPQLNEFIATISDGETNLGHLMASTRASKAQTWEGAKDRFDEDVDAAIERCGGEERAAVKSLLVLTEFLGLGAFGEAGVASRRKRPKQRRSIAPAAPC